MANQKSFLDEEKLSLLKLALSNGKEFEEQMQNHVKNYFWIRNNYLKVRVLEKNHFLEEIEAIRKENSTNTIKQKIQQLENYEHEIKQKKEEIRKRYKINEELENIFNILETMSWWIDQRKVIMLQFFHTLTQILHEVNRRYSYEGNLIFYLLPNEITDLLKGKPIQVEELKTRRSRMIYALDQHLNGTMIKGNEAKEIMDAYFNKSKNNEIRGLVASTGNGTLTAKVSVVMDINKDKFTPNTILVTSMTRPEFVPLMRKAKAVITDEGGITCHAAIVSRELGIPCIIGTKNATKLLKSGNSVEINTTTGTIKTK